MLLWAKSERVDVDARVWSAGVAEEGLDEVKVGSLTLREAVLAVELELGSDHGVFAPAVELERSLGQYKGTRIRHVGFRRIAHSCLRDEVWIRVVRSRSRHVRIPHVTRDVVDRVVNCARVLEETIRVDEIKVVTVATLSCCTSNRVRTAERVDCVGERIDRIGVVEWLGTKHLVEESGRLEGRAVVDVRIWLDNPDEFLDGVVEVELDLVRGGTDRLITRELELIDEVLVGVLGHTTAFIRVEEHVVDEEGSRNERLVVGLAYLDRAAVGREGGDRPETLINGAKIDVDADLVVLESNERERKTGVLAEPELERDVEGGFREGIARGADLARSIGLARAIDVGEGGVREVSELGGVANHCVVALLLARAHGELVPDVHPVAVVAVNALTTNLDFDLGDELLAREVEPSGIDALSIVKILADLWKCYLKNGVVSKISVSGDGAGYTASEIGLTVESLFNGFHGKVGVSAVGHLPVGNLRVSRKIYILCAVSY